MPRAPERPCRNAVCPKTTADAGGYCAACRPASGRAEREQRGSATARGYGYSWQQRRARIIQRDPVCVSCKRAWTTEVDHVLPKAQGGTDDEANLQGLCKPCHSTKTAREDGGFGRAPRASAQAARMPSEGMGESNPSTRIGCRPSPAPARAAAKFGLGGYSAS